jgi:hypothetical protein
MKPNLILKKYYDKYNNNIKSINKINKLKTINIVIYIIIFLFILFGVLICYDKYNEKKNRS